MNVSLRTLVVVMVAGLVIGILPAVLPALGADEPAEPPGASAPNPGESQGSDASPRDANGEDGSLRELELPAIEIPAFEIPPVETLQPGSHSSRVYDAFRRAVEGKWNQAAGTGDPIADDILGTVRTSSSVVGRFPQGPLLETADSEASSSGLGGSASQRAIAAEQLLRAARLLERFGEGEPEQVSLIRQMRFEARRLLPAERRLLPAD